MKQNIEKTMEQKKQVFAVMPIGVYEDVMRFLRKLPFETVEQLLPHIKNNTRAVETTEEDKTPAPVENVDKEPTKVEEAPSA